MKLDLSGLTPQEITDAIATLAETGFAAFGQPELVALAAAVDILAKSIETAIEAPSPAATLTAAVDAADAAADEAERIKVGS